MSSKSTEYRELVKSIFNVDLPYRHIYHYTTPAVAVKILESDACSEFYCTHYRFLNDDDEFSLGIDIVLEWLRIRAKSLSRVDMFDLADRVEQVIRSKVKSIIDSAYTPWILSFSRDMDSVPQWASYTDRKEGGYAIGVNFDRLIESMSIDWSDQRNLWFVAPCVYVDVYSKKEPDFTSVFPILDRLIKVLGGIDRFVAKSSTLQFAKIAILFASLIKSRDFRTEREWRVVYLTGSTLDPTQVEIVGGKPRIRLEHKRANEIVGKLVVSHHGNRSRLKIIADLLATKYGFMVRESKTSYIGL